MKKVTKKFLNNLADKIYNPKDRSFLRLCNGTLQNGPDPTNEKRPMHCGLGELYFEMTDQQPEVAGVNEETVVDTAVDLASFKDGGKKKAAIKAIKALGLPEDTEEDLLSTVEEHVVNSGKFRALLNDIPEKNDDGKEEYTKKVFVSRAKRVAAQLRKAAELLA